MVVVLFLLALASIAGGAAAIFFGSDILLADRGLPMIIAGGTVAAAGLVLFGLAIVARGLRRVERFLAGLGTSLPVQTPEPAPIRAPIEPPAADSEPDAPQLPLPEPPRSTVEPREPDVTVVGRYASGGNSYVMYSDNSIEAETPAGRHRFASLDDLRAFVAAGGERGEPS